MGRERQMRKRTAEHHRRYVSLLLLLFVLYSVRPTLPPPLPFGRFQYFQRYDLTHIRTSIRDSVSTSTENDDIHDNTWIK